MGSDSSSLSEEIEAGSQTKAQTDQSLFPDTITNQPEVVKVDQIIRNL